jgi:hypothetical protein
MQNEEKNNGVQPQLGGTPEVDIESAETGSYQSVEHPSRPRKDKARLHATRHGILSRPLLEALARRGENIRQLRGIERALREDLRPVGAELLFDRMWSSFLRCLLIEKS